MRHHASCSQAPNRSDDQPRAPTSRARYSAAFMLHTMSATSSSDRSGRSSPGRAQVSGEQAHVRGTALGDLPLQGSALGVGDGGLAQGQPDRCHAFTDGGDGVGVQRDHLPRGAGGPDPADVLALHGRDRVTGARECGLDQEGGRPWSTPTPRTSRSTPPATPRSWTASGRSRWKACWVHLCTARKEGGLRYTDVWESEAQCARAFDTRIHPAVDAAFGGVRPPVEPVVVRLDVVDLTGALVPHPA